MKTSYFPKGVCSKRYDLELDAGTIKSIKIEGGCSGNLNLISKVLTGKKAKDMIPLLRGTVCQNHSSSCPDQISYALEEALKLEAEQDKIDRPVYSSALEIDMEKEYIFHNYQYLQKEFSPIYGVNSAADVVIQPVYLDELCYVLSSPGTHVVLFGGTWSDKTQNVMDRINYFAKKNNVNTVYTFDFRADGHSEDSNIKEDITSQESYIGPGKKKSVGCANCNYIYGELVTRHLTNLNDWVSGKIGSGDDITYLNLYQDAITVPNLHEPFLFVFNKDNKIDYSEMPHHQESEFYPILGALELDAFRGADGLLYQDISCTLPDPEFDLRLQKVIFDKIGESGIAQYSHSDYMFEAYQKNERGHAFKTEDAFQKGEQINLQPVTLAQFLWMLDQKGTFLFLFAGPWCANSQAGVATVNDYAVANHVRVYVLDTRYDGKHAIDFWKYPRLNEMTDSHPTLKPISFEIWENRLPGAPVLSKVRRANLAYHGSLTMDYTDPEGTKHSIIPVDAPYLIACNMQATDSQNSPTPVLAACNHGGIELINCMKSYVYAKPNYRLYTAGVYKVFSAYCDDLNLEVKDIEIDRTAPIVDGEPVRHVETIAYHKDHDWFKERGGRENLPDPSEAECDWC